MEVPRVQDTHATACHAERVAVTKVQSPAVSGPAHLQQQSLTTVPLRPNRHRSLEGSTMFQTGLALGGVAGVFPLEQI
jgi:hypothetical protein